MYYKQYTYAGRAGTYFVIIHLQRAVEVTNYYFGVAANVHVLNAGIALDVLLYMTTFEFILLMKRHYTQV